MVWNVGEGNHKLVTVSVLLAPAAGDESVEAPQDFVTGELELWWRPWLDVLLVPLVEVVERTTHHNTKIVRVFAPRSSQESLHLRLRQEHDVVVLSSEKLEVWEPERVLSKLVLMNNMEDHHQIRITLVLLESLEDVTSFSLHGSLLIQAEVSRERNNSFTPPHALLEVNSLSSISDLDSQLRANDPSIGAEPLDKGSPVLLQLSLLV
mmetsp:Transcript_25607/g.57590  ORF Transcript_25607/g.57590 Transcript_25607/m.57590 type:complete len:208 (+) Transcript_25607:291-914(+)